MIVKHEDTNDMILLSLMLSVILHFGTLSFPKCFDILFGNTLPIAL